MKKLFLILTLLISITTMAQEQKTMVAYFSATGTTRAVAKQLANEKNAFLWEIVPAEPYTDADLDWRDKQSRSSVEMADEESRPTIAQCADITQFTDIYIGFPIWWYICPRIIQSWIDNNISQLEGKRLFPFATSGGSPIEPAVEYLKKHYPTLNWQDGKLMNGR